jgi:hypothetical protein
MQWIFVHDSGIDLFFEPKFKIAIVVKQQGDFFEFAKYYYRSACKSWYLGMILASCPVVEGK